MSTVAAIRSFRDLIAWQKAMDLVAIVYEQTNNLPDAERFGLTSQMRRCAVSIPSNIAEGWDRSTPDYLRFLSMSRGSTHELATQAELCDRLEFDGDWLAVMERTEEVGRILNGLIAAIERSNNRLH